TAGSIRVPSFFCGVTGLRPSTGLVSLRGVVPLSPSFDTVGPLARTAEDCALLLRTIAGPDPDDPSTLAAPVPDYVAALGQGLYGLRVGVVAPLLERGLDPRIAD